jgi:hypothetical protein
VFAADADLLRRPPAEAEEVLAFVVQPSGFIDGGAGDMQPQGHDHLVLQAPTLPVPK